MSEQSWSTSDGSRRKVGTVSGDGCTTRQSSLPIHNPEPSTERGKRRHASRSEDLQNRAKKAWGLSRTNKKSRFHKAIGHK
jgi:hypothetical protein